MKLHEIGTRGYRKMVDAEAARAEARAVARSDAEYPNERAWVLGDLALRLIGRAMDETERPDDRKRFRDAAEILDKIGT